MRGAIVVCYGGNFGWCHCRAIAVCYGCRGGDDQLWGSGRGAIDMVPLLGAIVGCHCSVLWWGWRPTLGSGRGAIAGCHCSMLWLGGRVTTNFAGVALLGAIAEWQSLFHISLLYSGPPISPRHPWKQQWILSWASCRRYTVLYIDNTKTGFCYLGSMLGIIFWYRLRYLTSNPDISFRDSTTMEETLEPISYFPFPQEIAGLKKTSWICQLFSGGTLTGVFTEVT